MSSFSPSPVAVVEWDPSHCASDSTDGSSIDDLECVPFASEGEDALLISAGYAMTMVLLAHWISCVWHLIIVGDQVVEVRGVLDRLSHQCSEEKSNNGKRRFGGRGGERTERRVDPCRESAHRS